MGYKITNKTKQNAKGLGVEIKKSTNSKKKLDVFKNDKKIASVGATGYGDYNTFIKEKGKAFADKRKTAYKARHQKTRTKVGSNSYYADQLLWK
tara:strand:+ start:158 stop:439 length:282 start_codon:yes stop_codon:yes gene_type:complete